MLKKTKITSRIALGFVGFGVVVSLMLVLAVTAYWALQSVEQRMARAIQQDAKSLSIRPSSWQKI